MTIEDMLSFQRELQRKYEGVWEGDSPATAKHHLLYAVEEIGEVSAILKKKTPEAVAGDDALKDRLCEEMTDVFMYLCDVLLCLDITPERFEAAYRAKMAHNLQRDFVREHNAYLKDEAST